MTVVLPKILRTVEEVDALPVGSVVLKLWGGGPLRGVLQKYSDGWFGTDNEHAQSPLGNATFGGAVMLLWDGDQELPPAGVTTTEDDLVALGKIVNDVAWKTPIHAIELGDAEALRRQNAVLVGKAMLARLHDVDIQLVLDAPAVEQPTT